MRADATCPAPQNQLFVVGSLARLAQTFTAGISCNLARGDLGLGHPGQSKNGYLLRVAPLVDGLPGDATLTTAQVNAASVPAGISQFSFSFANPAPLVAGTSYSLVLAADRIDSLSWLNELEAISAGNASNPELDEALSVRQIATPGSSLLASVEFGHLITIKDRRIDLQSSFVISNVAIGYNVKGLPQFRETVCSGRRVSRMVES